MPEAWRYNTSDSAREPGRTTIGSWKATQATKTLGTNFQFFMQLGARPEWHLSSRPRGDGNLLTGRTHIKRVACQGLNLAGQSAVGLLATVLGPCPLSKRLTSSPFCFARCAQVLEY